MNRKTATLLSFVFHPLLMPCITLAVMMGTDPVVSQLLPVRMKLIILGLAFITTVLAPMSVIFLIRRVGLIASVYMKTREERGIPLLVIALFYYLTYYLLKGLHLPQIYALFFLSATLMIILLIAFNFFRKLSLHMAGLGAFTGLLTGMAIQYGLNVTGFVMAAILISGMIGTARLKLDAHRPSDLYIGWLAGAVVMVLTGLLL